MTIRAKLALLCGGLVALSVGLTGLVGQATARRELRKSCQWGRKHTGHKETK